MTNPSASPQITIRHCNAISDYDECVRVEHATWGEEISVPNGIFIVAHHTGGQGFAAYDGPKMIGFTLAAVGVRKFHPHSGEPYPHGKYTPYFYSHMTPGPHNSRKHGSGRWHALSPREDAWK